MKAAVFAGLATALLQMPAAAGSPQGEIECGGLYRGHVQGADSDGTNVWWSFTGDIVRTDLSGKVLAAVDVGGHHGDLCVRDGLLYVAVERGRFNAAGPSRSAVVCYRGDTLEKIREWPLPDTVYGAGGIAAANGFFYVVGGLPPGGGENLVFQYDSSFRLVKRHVLKTGYTRYGIQTISFAGGKFYLGFYGTRDEPAGTFVCDGDFSAFRRFVPDCSNGLFPANGTLMRVLFRHDGERNLYGAGAEKFVLREIPAGRAGTNRTISPRATLSPTRSTSSTTSGASRRSSAESPISWPGSIPFSRRPG